MQITAKSPARQNQKKLLIVEDDISVSSPISLLLKHYEFDVVMANTLAQGIACLNQNPDLIVLGLQLPGGNGLEVLRKIRGTGKNTKVIILSRESNPEIERACRRLMPDGFFHEPFNFIEILNTVRRATADGSARDAFAA